MPNHRNSNPLSRRRFVALAAGGVAAGILPTIPPAQAGEPFNKARIKAIVFDAFPIFDPRPVFALAEQLFPGKGAALSDEWRARQFEYTWLRVVAHRYADFWQVTREALEFAADKLKLKLGREE